MTTSHRRKISIQRGNGGNMRKKLTKQEKEIKEAINELQAVMNFNTGKRAEITQVDGLNLSGTFGESGKLIDRTQVKFLTKLSKKNSAYVNNAMTCDPIDVCEVARVMNMLDCGFTHAAKAYFRNDKSSYAILQELKRKGEYKLPKVKSKI